MSLFVLSHLELPSIILLHNLVLVVVGLREYLNIVCVVWVLKPITPKPYPYFSGRYLLFEI